MKIGIMILITTAKILVFGCCMLPIAFSALATGVLFGCCNLSMARNPEEKDYLFNNTMLGFGFIETFVFIAIILGGVVKVAL